MSAAEDKPKSATRTRIVAWSIFLVATVLYFLSGTFLNEVQLGYYFGQALLYFLLLAIVLALVGRKKSPEFKATLTLVGTIIWGGFLFFVVVHLNSKQLEVESARQEVRELAQTGREALVAHKAIIDNLVADTPPPSVQESPATTPQTPRQPAHAVISMSELVRGVNAIAKDVYSRSLNDQGKIAADVEKIGLETVLLPQTISTSTGIDQNRAKIRKYSDLLERSMAVSRAAITEMDKRVSTLVSGQPNEGEFLRGYANGKKNRTDLEAKMYENQKATIAAMTKINDFMAARLGRVTLQSDRLLFRTQEELDTYNSLLSEIQHQAQAETQLQKMYQDTLQKNVNELEKLAK